MAVRYAASRSTGAVPLFLAVAALARCRCGADPVPGRRGAGAGRTGPARRQDAAPPRGGAGARRPGGACAGGTRGCAGAARRGGAMGKSRARRFRRAPFSPAGPEPRRDGQAGAEEEPAAELLEKVRASSGGGRRPGAGSGGGGLGATPARERGSRGAVRPGGDCAGRRGWGEVWARPGGVGREAGCGAARPGARKRVVRDVPCRRVASPASRLRPPAARRGEAGRP